MPSGWRKRPFRNDASLVAAIRTTLAMTETKRNDYRRHARQRVLERYCWDTVTSQYEQLFVKLMSA